jgi:hypothetical protein
LRTWDWTIQYAATHPFGGGFNCYVINRIELPNGAVFFGRSFQSIYFEMLGEHGWFGLGLFLGIIAWTFFGLRRLARRTRDITHLAWCADLADALTAGIVVFMTAGAFVDITFQPELWYFVALFVSLSEYVRRAQQTVAPAIGWRAHALPTAATATAASSGIAAPWRHRSAWSKPAGFGPAQK